MLRFILRRIGISIFILWLGSLFMYVLTINSGDPLQELRESRDPNRELQIQLRIETMQLDEPWYERYLGWLSGAAQCLVLQCDFGTDRAGIDINTSLGFAAASTLRLVTLATVLAIVIGIAMGMVAAIRQYSGFDYAVTFAAFLFYSLPVFWVAVLLKQYGAIEFNRWIADPTVSPTVAVAIGAVFAVTVGAVLGGEWKRRILSGAIAGVVAVGALLYFDAVNWFRQPALGLPLVVLFGVGAAVALTVLTTGLRNRRVLYTGLLTVAAGVVGYFVFSGWIAEPSYLKLFVMLVISLAVGALIGWFVGGWDRRAAMWVGVITALMFALAVVGDQLLRSWGSFLQLKGNRPVIGTIGSGSPGFEGPFWEGVLDWGVQLILPTIVLTVISLASYSRYTRSSMLETLHQDYIRTARSKGLSDRVVFTRHAFRNALIPITTIVAFDFASLIGGAVVTETVFGWQGMGAMFRDGLDKVDPGPVMAFYVVTGTAAVLMNMLADITYAFLDPRIRR